ncbi:MAG: DM13 domain-containing protein [Pseudomonadota bacterium]
MLDRRTFLFTAAATAGATMAAPALADPSGQFTGATGHVTKGRATLSGAAGAQTVVLQDDFWFDGAPDPRVGLGRNGKFDPDTDLGELRKNTGGQTYSVPAGLDLSRHNEIYIWCRKFSVPLGVAKLN